MGSDYNPRGESGDFYTDYVAEAQDEMWTPRDTAKAISKLNQVGEA